MAFEPSTRHAIVDALTTSGLGVCLTSSLSNIIMQFLVVEDIFFCSHKGSEVIAFSIHGDYLGTIVKTVADEDAHDHDQWLTGFDFDSHGTLYVALRIGFIGKYKIPSDQHPFSTMITPRDKDEIFDSKFQQSLRRFLRGDNADDLCPEGLRVVEHDKYHSVLMTCMDPLNGILQISFEGVIVRVICQNMMEQPWSLEIIPSFFTKDVTSPFLRDRTLVMVAERKTLRMIDLDRGTIMNSMDFVYGSNSTVGDFTFVDPLPDGKAVLIVNLEDGLLQFHQCEMLWMLKSFDLNKWLSSFKGLRGRRIMEAYGTSIGPDGAIYFSDHDNNRIIRMEIKDWNFVVDPEHFDEEMEASHFSSIGVFARGMVEPNYSQWYRAAQIGLDFVNYPEDEFEAVIKDGKQTARRSVSGQASRAELARALETELNGIRASQLII